MGDTRTWAGSNSMRRGFQLKTIISMASPYACWAPRRPLSAARSLFASSPTLSVIVGGAMVVVVHGFSPTSALKFVRRGRT